MPRQALGLTCNASNHESVAVAAAKKYARPSDLRKPGPPTPTPPHHVKLALSGAHS